MKKIEILALHLGYGGIEKAICDLSNMLIDNYEIEIIAAYKLYDKYVFNLDKRVKVRYLINSNLSKRVEVYKKNLKSLKLIKLIKNLYKDYFKKFRISSLVKDTFLSMKMVIDKRKLMINYVKNSNSDIIISTRDIYNEILGKYAKKEVLKIGWEHNNDYDDIKKKKRIIESVKNLDYFVLVSKDLKRIFEGEIKKPKCIYIPNVIDEFPLKLSNLNEKNIISIGRLSQEKGYIDLIDVFNIVSEKYPDWKLNIIGDGDLKRDIDSYIKEKKLLNSIIMHGFQDKKYINNILTKSSIYVMTSFNESFGIVLLEAFSHGVPCIAFDSAKGPQEIIEDNKNGYLIKNRSKEKMANKIIKLIEEKNLRKELGVNGRKRAEKFTKEKIKPMWIDILEKM